MNTSARAPLRSLSAIVFAAFLAMSLIVTTVDALAATPIGADRVRSDTPSGELREFFHGRGLLSITWE